MLIFWYTISLMTVDKMTVDEMPLDEMPCRRMISPHGYGLAYSPFSVKKISLLFKFKHLRGGGGGNGP
jgi:hypothetical protein